MGVARPLITPPCRHGHHTSREIQSFVAPYHERCVVLDPEIARVLTSAQPRVTQFTGSSKVAEILVEALDGKVRYTAHGERYTLGSSG